VDRSGSRLVGLVVGLAAVAAVGWFAFSGQVRPATFGYDRSDLLETWNEAAFAENRPGFIVREFQWTDEAAGVFGFAFSETMSLIGRVDDTPLAEVEELALVGSRADDGLETIVAGMDLVIAVTEEELDTEARAEVLAELTLTGVVPADPSRRLTIDTTRFRVAADPENGILGIGATPVGAEDRPDANG